MTAVTIYFAAAAAIVAIGTYGVLVARALVRKLIAVNVMGAGVFLIWVAAAARPANAPEPVPHAMVLTGIVVTVAATGLAATLIRRLAMAGEGDALPEDRGGGA